MNAVRLTAAVAGVLLFAESMEEVGDCYAIAGFCSKYRDNVSYYNIKDFDRTLVLDDRTTSIAYVWNADENYWPDAASQDQSDPFGHADGL